MHAVIERYYEPKQTRGVFKLFDDRNWPIISFMTLELPWLNNQRQISCIPEGQYLVTPFSGTKYKNVWEVTNVPNRTAILLHWANFVGSKNPKTGKPDLLGCVAMGDYLKDVTGDGIVEILNSRNQIQSFREVIGKNSFYLTIRKAL